MNGPGNASRDGKSRGVTLAYGSPCVTPAEYYDLIDTLVSSLYL